MVRTNSTAHVRSSHSELNISQLMRQEYGEDAILVGFTTYTGTVTAASDWGGPSRKKQVRPSLPGSFGALFHETGIPNFLIILRDREIEPLEEPRLQRAIGVLYLPESERASHYFTARLPQQFDAVIHFDETNAVEPLVPATGPAASMHAFGVRD